MKHHCPTCTCHTSKSLIGKYVKIKPGTFIMGSPESEAGRWDDETQHEVTITRPYEMAATTITQKQYYGTGGDEPAVNISWDDVQAYIAKLNVEQSKYTYRLPTEAEWEYAARAGTTGPYPFPAHNIEEHAWLLTNSGDKLHPVAQKLPNSWGLYDMHGNLWEWCEDWYGEYPGGPRTDSAGPKTGSYRVVRGGSWSCGARLLRSAVRFSVGPGERYPSVGFRPARSLR